jgi:type III pantothenate kinase
MLLAIDCGNTNTVMTLFEGLDKQAEWRMATDVNRTADDHVVWLVQHFKATGFDEDVVADVVISTVVPSCLRSFEGLAKYFGAAYFVIDPGRDDHGVTTRIPDAKQAGADRIANTKGAALYKLPAMVIDFGTATTFDLVDGDGAYIGGAIAPGVNLSMTALHQAAARLPLIDSGGWGEDTPVLGMTTVEAMNSGLYHGYISLVEGMILRLKQVCGQEMTVIVTGGMAHIFSTVIRGVDYHDPNLTMKGMAMIYQHQKKASS